MSIKEQSNQTKELSLENDPSYINKQMSNDTSLQMNKLKDFLPKEKHFLKVNRDDDSENEM